MARGVLTASDPQELVEQVLANCGRRELRCRLVPAPTVAYYALAMTLFREAVYEGSAHDTGYPNLGSHLQSLGTAGSGAAGSALSGPVHSPGRTRYSLCVLPGLAGGIHGRDHAGHRWYREQSGSIRASRSGSGMLILADLGFTAHPLFPTMAGAGTGSADGVRGILCSECWRGIQMARFAPPWRRHQTSAQAQPAERTARADH